VKSAPIKIFFTEWVDKPPPQPYNNVYTFQFLVFQESLMKIQKTNALQVECNNEVYLNTYVSTWSGTCELKFSGYESDGSEYKLNVQLPLDRARALAYELNADLEHYDKQKAKEAKELAEKVSEVEGSEDE
tara:strand:- start:1906 stop:2298 length:393 start_codon:yes stop_codon:yes gene_type:complete